METSLYDLRSQGADLMVLGSKPAAGAVFMIEQVSTGHLVTLLNGEVQVIPKDELPTATASHWQCVEKDGWFGFRESASYRYLGIDSGAELEHELLVCKNKNHTRHGMFQVREVGERTYQLLMVAHQVLGLAPICPLQRRKTTHIKWLEEVRRV
ncbi:unnamed protein product [Periconia digitata]|uniref:Uncharacterized protein n=1 Tax=Periconia digitata TaxID=1303443 RepID=A0A9W4UPD2_9PLEO|nr:unnamed protein product [Periconia digitata]